MQTSDGDQVPLLTISSVKPAPETLTKLIQRLRALTSKLISVEVDVHVINDPTSRVITPHVISAYKAAAGDFVEALPYCLLCARAEFMWNAYHNPADYGEDRGRAIACEVLARRIVHQTVPEQLISTMVTRFRHRRIDGELSEFSSAIEVGVDSHCTIFLSSPEAQGVINSLWDGEVIPKVGNNDEIDYVPRRKSRSSGVWSRIDPSRMSVPRYQNFFRIVVWLIFLVVYSQAVQEPLDRLDPDHNFLDGWEFTLYTMALSFCVEDIFRWYKFLRYATYRAFDFWNIVALVTDMLLLAAFVLRMVGLDSSNSHTDDLRLKSFQILSFVSPLIWMKLVTVFDGVTYVGTMQICVARMLKESGIFFALLSVLGFGFWQGLYALDAADGKTDQGHQILNVLIQALLQAPNYDRFGSSPAGLAFFYFWNVATAVILLNILISLFAQAYSDIIDDAEAEYLTFFAGKTIGMIRAPDSYVYPAPFNLIEVFLVIPFALTLNANAYAEFNRWMMGIVFFIPLTVIALLEAASTKDTWLNNWLLLADEGEENPVFRNPEVEGVDAQRGLQISKVPFDELVKMLPDTQQSSEARIVRDIQDVREQLEILLKKVEELKA